jgi:hypothetical protein
MLLDTEEAQLKENYDLTLEQLRWRRTKIHDAEVL